MKTRTCIQHACVLTLTDPDSRVGPLNSVSGSQVPVIPRSDSFPALTLIPYGSPLPRVSWATLTTRASSFRIQLSV
ncbi:integumentary mucin A.1 [Biomphalaria pfeifferi]|uniref:Integumentary mucin A.1 n=1 Tax=Biomphalaria pfeifferi TaxID=112525 RepID=A0AAD8AWE2_BIOPF|nr:integumentary mucin A.1 [Biomphalaria pfeifferi]